MNSGLHTLIVHLLTNQDTTLDFIEKDIKLTESKIVEYINYLNKRLENKYYIQLDETGSVSMKGETRERLYHMLKNFEFNDFDHIPPEIRTNLIIILLLTDNKYYSLQDLADFVEVSKNTMLLDMKMIKEVVRSYSLTVEYSRSDGYRISGSEYNIRKLLVTELKQLLHRESSSLLLQGKKFINKDNIFLLKERLLKVEKKLEISFTDEQLDQLPIILHLLIKRIMAFKREWHSEVIDYDLTNTKNYHTVKDIFWNHELNENDQLYLVLQVLSSNLLESALDVSRDEGLKYAVKDFLDLLEEYLVTKLINKTKLKNKLITHLRPAIYRTWLNLDIQNPLMGQFINQYSSIYSIVSKSVYPIEEFMGKSFSKEEIVYIAMHIQAWMYQTEDQTAYAFKTLVVCRNGTSVSKLLLESLKGMFCHFEFMGAFAERNFKNYENEVDFIFSTVPLNTVKKTFIVNPILNKEARISLKNQIRQYIDQDSDKRAKELMYHLSEFIDENDYKKVENRIKDFFKDSLEIESPDNQTMNHHIFDFKPEHILFTDRDMSWEEALEKVFTPMKERQSVTDQYFKKVKELFATEGNRMMIGPSVYLPHASPSNGVIREDFSILMCKHRVESIDGQLIKLMILLATEEGNHHVPTLLFLNEIFLDETKAEKIYTANSSHDIINLINLYKGTGRQ